MRIAFLVMAHKDPEQIERLVTRLNHPDFDFYIHLDKKIDIGNFAYLQQHKRVFFTLTRIHVSWASFSFTTAIYKCMEEILTSPEKYDFIDVLSGQDYPIKPTNEIHKYFSAHQGRNFISFEKEGSDWWQHAIGRVSNYHFINYKFPGRYRLQAVVNAVMPKRKFPLPYILYGGPRASWFTMSHDCAAYVVKFMNDHPKLRRFCNFTWGSDEFLFQTIIMNSDYAGTVLNDVINYIDWSGGGANPKILTVKDFESLQTSDKLFARKFDIKVDSEILDLLDRQV
ncbi:MAG: glycosyltransferase [Bacteroidetes bacterium]|nr:glycosyltransferase [Bacteroidota bacterium]